MKSNNEIDKLIYLFSKLPGLGSRSARRIVLHLLQDPDVRLKGLIHLLQSVEENIITCEICGNLDSISPCNICVDQNRMKDVIAIVETVSDLWAMEEKWYI
jgi:recombination protein RecR